LRKWFESSLKILFGAYFALTSLYCLLAFLPYTYYALIKAPAYSWVPWFVRHHALLFWMAWAAAAVAHRSNRKRAAYFVCFGILACVGVFLSVRPFLAGVESNRTAYWGSLVALWAIILTVSLCGWQDSATPESDAPLDSHLSYRTGILLAVGVALLSVMGARLRNYSDTRSLSLHVSDIYLTFWSVISHLLVAMVLISILNLVRIAASKSVHSSMVRRGLIGVLIFGSLWALSVRFLENALSFEGWPAHLYAASLSAALTLLGFSVALPFLAWDGADSRARSGRRTTLLIVVSVLLALIAVTLPTLVGGGDWNGLYEGTFTLLFWIILSFCLFRLRPRAGAYPVKTVLTALLLSLLSYKALEATDIFWSKPLGATDDDIQRSMENYAVHDVSFNLAHHLLGGGRSEACGELCRILREYTEVRGAQARFDLRPAAAGLKRLKRLKPGFCISIAHVRADRDV